MTLNESATDSLRAGSTTEPSGSRLPPSNRSRVRPRALSMLAAATVATSILVLFASAPASASGRTSAATPSSTAAAGDVLFWARSNLSNGPFSSHSIVKASTTAPSLIATVLAGGGDFGIPDFGGPEVSPDGAKLAYIRDLGESQTLEVRDLASGSTTVLVSETGAGGFCCHIREPTWSPSGDAIAYVSEVPGSFPEVKVVAPSGGSSRTVQDSALAAAWRPDGRLTVARVDPQDNTATALWITGATPADAVLIPGSAGAREHAWSPDGTQVVFSKVKTVTGGTELDTLPAAGGTASALVPGSNGDFNDAPVWSSDGQRVYFSQRAYDPGAESPSYIKQVPRTGGAVSTVFAGGYNIAPSVTTRVAAPVPSRSHDFNGDGYADVIGRMPNGDLRLYFGNGLALSGYRVIGTGWSSLTAIFSPGDFNGDGHPDVIGRMSNGDLRLYFGTGTGLSGFRVIGTGWGGMTAVFSPGDFNGDGHPDVIGRTSTGDLRLYFGNGTTLSGFSVIGTRWAGFSAVFSPGDFNGDGHPDVIGRASSTGDLRLYFGTGTALSGFAVIGTGWSGLSALFSPGDFNLDGRPDVIGRISNGDLRVYYGNGSRLSGYRVIGIGWNGLNPLL